MVLMFSLLALLYSNQSFQMRKQLFFKTSFFYIKMYKFIHPTSYQHKLDFLKSCWYIYCKFKDLIYFLFSIYLFFFKVTLKEILFHERKQFFAVRHALENIFLTAIFIFLLHVFFCSSLKKCFLFKLFLALSENNEYKTWALGILQMDDSFPSEYIFL